MLIGHILIRLGLLLGLAGVIVILWTRFGLPRLPGDFVVRRGGITFFFPIATSILVSIILTLLLNLLFRRKP